jgi:mannose-6-phosphate isomerase
VEIPLAPLQLRSSLHETIWGGQNLAQFAGKHLPAGARIGESWETATDSVIVHGPLAGQTLSQAANRLGSALLGMRPTAIFGPRFPLLAKFLDAQEKLSVQVHPDDTYAAQHEGGKLGKTEAWYVLHADPGAAVVYGWRRPTSPAEVQSAIATLTLDALLHYEPVQTGDVILVPAGTVHAISAGIVLYELQEYSDITYRLYDYGRVGANGKPRDLHIAQSLAVMRYEPATRVKVQPFVVEHTAVVRRRILVACHYFLLEEIELSGTLCAATDGGTCVILTVLAGAATVQRAHSADPLMLHRGDTAVIPADPGAYHLEGQHCRLLRAWVPAENDPLTQGWQELQVASG